MIIKFFVFLIPVAAATIGGIYFYEKKKGRSITLRFLDFTKKYRITEQDLRSVPRILVPESINVVLKLSEKEYARQKGKVIDMSLSGFRVSFRSPFGIIPEDQMFADASVITPLSRISIGRLKIVRIESSVKRVVFALYIKEIDDTEYSELKKTMIYFEKFSKNGT